MTPIGGNDIVLFTDGVLNACGNSFLTCGKMAETSNFLFLIESICGHFHASIEIANQNDFLSKSASVSHLIDTIS